MKNEFLSRLLEELKFLNKVPKFQLERAISPLLGIFITEIINKQFNVSCIHSISEFPIRPLKHKEDFQSTNIDWLLFDSVNHTLYLIEFKTDLYSLDKSQYDNYKEIWNKVNNSKTASFLYNDILDITPNSNRPEKYQTIIEFIKSNSIDFSDYSTLKIIYFIPSEKKNFELEDDDEFLYFYQLHNDIGLKDFQEEWIQLLDFLKTLPSKNGKKEKCN